MNKKRFLKKWALLVVLLVALSWLWPPGISLASSYDPAEIPVTVEIGPTPIVNGACLAEDDITVRNGYFAISISNSTVPPWGVPNGSILDAASIVNGEIQPDRITLVDFLPDAWAGWPSTYSKVVIEEYPANNGGERCVVRVERDYKGAQLVTRFIVEKGSKEVRMITEMTNSSAETYEIYSGYSLCTSGGYMLAPFNLSSEKNDLGYAFTEDEYGKFVVGYNEDWAIGLHFPNAGFHDGGTGWKDLYEHNILEPGEEYIAEAWLQFEGSGNIAPIFENYVRHIGKAATLGTIAGTVTYDSEEAVSQPVVVVEKDGKPLTWAMGNDGRYSLMLPAGLYNLYAVAKNCAPSTVASVDVTAESTIEQNFNDVKLGGTVLLNASDTAGNPVYAKITATGGTPPVVRFLGASTFFTGLGSERGKASFVLAPGDYTLEVSSGGGFVSKAVKRDISVAPGSRLVENVVVETIEVPSARGWYSADLHHHADKLDGITPPDYLVQSQLAA